MCHSVEALLSVAMQKMWLVYLYNYWVAEKRSIFLLSFSSFTDQVWITKSRSCLSECKKSKYQAVCLQCLILLFLFKVNRSYYLREVGKMPRGKTTFYKTVCCRDAVIKETIAETLWYTNYKREVVKLAAIRQSWIIRSRVDFEDVKEDAARLSTEFKNFWMNLCLLIMEKMWWCVQSRCCKDNSSC